MASYTTKYPKIDKICRHCGATFQSNNIRRIYCSTNCGTQFLRNLDMPKFLAYVAKRRRDRSPEKRKLDSIRKRSFVLRSKYGITLLEFDEMKLAQEGKCAICKNTRELVIDHDHKTRKIRGLLCHTCNRALGLFSDSVKLLLNASSYVRKYT